MPEITSLLPTLAACALLCLGIDCYAATRKPETAAKSHNANEGRLSDFVLFTPFAALIYSDELWSNLLATLPLLLLTLAAQAICYKKRWLKVAPEPWPFISGPYMLAVLGYFMFFREDILVESAPVTSTVDKSFS